MKRQSSQGGSCPDSTSCLLARNNWYLSSFTVALEHLVAYNLQVNSWSTLERFLDTDHSFPSRVNASWYFLFFCVSLKARIFPFPAKALTVSQPVNKCTSTNFSLVCVLLLTYNWQANSWANKREMMNTTVSWDAMMIAVDSSYACFACSNMRVSASSYVLHKLSTSRQVSSVTLKHFLSLVTYMTMLRSFTLSDCICRSWARNLMRLPLFLDKDKRRLYCLTLWPATMLLKRIPLSDPRLTLSAFFMDSSRYTSNTTSIRELSVPVCNADMKMAFESSAKVLLSPWTFWTRFMPSMMQVDGCGFPSANDTFFQAVGPGWTCLSSSVCRHSC